MAATDSISVFAEGTFEEQARSLIIQELVNYIVRNRSDDDRAAFIHPFQDALKSTGAGQPLEEDVERKRGIFKLLAAQVKGLGDGTEKEIEGFFNLLFAQLYSLHASDESLTRDYVVAFIQALTNEPSSQKNIKYRVLSNFFNATERTSPLRPLIYTSLVKISTSNGDLASLHINRTTVEKWLQEWNISQEDKAAFLKTITDEFNAETELETAYEYQRLYVQTLPTASPLTQDAAIDLIATALRLPDVLDFDPLFKLDAVVSAKDQELYGLLQIFLSGALPEFNAWVASRSGVLNKYNLDQAQLERKIRLLTLASLAFQYTGRDLPYSKVAEVIQVEPTEVERWAIDVIRAQLVWGKLSQATQSIHVTRATARAFEKEQWEALQKRLLAWKSGLNGILEVVVSAKRQAGLVQPQNVD
ncbi:hypothetical protein H0H93_010834 [Arthromyces matolae]|nr:hypothetical protein H0H93_010834 [Arthromyces matolae]